MKYLLYGKGISNKSIKRYFDKMDINYHIFDDSSIDNINLEDFDIIIKSPGIPNDTKFMKLAKIGKKTIISDLELYNLIKMNQYKIVISGSNGKTTVTSMLNEVLKDDFCCGGNIGIPLFDLIFDNKDGIIIEASSYMLEYSKSLKPNIYVLLNLEKHHIAHHKTFNGYIKAKLMPLKNMDGKDVFIYEYENNIINKVINLFSCNSFTFSLNNTNATCYVKDDFVYLNNEKLISINNFSLPGDHNLKNYLATILTLYVVNKKYLNVKYLDRLFNYKGLPHRMERVLLDNYKSTVFINDSKSTNLYSLISATHFVKQNYLLKKRIILVGGNYNNENISEYIRILKDFEYVILFSKAGKVIFDKTNIGNYFDTLEESLNFLFTYKLDNVVLLFSPGFQSYDEFISYEERGNFFKEYLNKKRTI